MVNDESPPSILDKAFTLLRSFSPDQRVMSLSEIARASGLPKSTVHRLLARLIELGAIEHHRSGYRIGLMMLQMSTTAPAIAMRDVAAPHLAALHLRTGLTIHLGVLRQFDVVVIETLARRATVAVATSAGSRLPANCTAMGKVLLAYEDLDDLEMFLPQPMPSLTPVSIIDVRKLVAELREVRQLGVAREANQATTGLACIAVPVEVMGCTVAALSIAYPSSHSPALSGLRATLREAGSRIATDVSAALEHGRVHWFPHEIDEVHARAAVPRAPDGGPGVPVTQRLGPRPDAVRPAEGARV